MGRIHNRKAVYSAIDSLLGWGAAGWTGNVQEVWNECARQGSGHVTFGLIRTVLRERGETRGRGIYHVTRDGFFRD